MLIILSCASTAMAMDFWDDLEEDTFPVLFELPGEEQCPLCYFNMSSDFEDLTTLPCCSKTFHTECIQEWANQPRRDEYGRESSANNCPYCREPHGIEAEIIEEAQLAQALTCVDLRSIGADQVRRELQSIITAERSEEVLFLALDNNQLEDLPEELSLFENLKELSCNNNYLTQDAIETICQLVSLETLALGNNNLESLPAEIGCLENLNKLSLANNQFTEFPDVLGRLALLSTLFFEGNSVDLISGIDQVRTLWIYDEQMNQVSEELREAVCITSGGF